MLHLSDFRGIWVLSRQIKDVKYGQDGRMTGEARFDTIGAGLIYCETGTLSLASGAAMQAERRYLWDADATGVVVRFADEKPFHRFDLTDTAQGTSHLCGDDWYNVFYDFSHWPAWSATWIVTGPRKDYTSTTHYQRS